MKLLRFLASAAHESHLVLEICFHKFLNWWDKLMRLATSIDLWVLECLRSISTFMVCLCVFYAVHSDFSSGGRRWSVKYNRSGLWINPDHLLFGVMEICMGPSTAMMVIAVLGALLCSVSVPCVWAQNSTGFWKYQVLRLWPLYPFSSMCETVSQ